MVHRFCAICGKTLNESAPHFGMCLKCYLKEKPLFELSTKITFKVCLDCGSYALKEEWHEPEENEIFLIIEEALNRFVLKSASKKNNYDFSISFDDESHVFSSKDLLTSLELMVHGSVKEDKKITHQQKIAINVNYEYCKNCTNLRGGTYFLSIVQLRVKDESQFDLLEETLAFIQKLVEKKFEKDQRQYITKTVDEKFGVDLYLSTNELMNYIIKVLRGNYNFLLKRTKKLVGRDTQGGRNIYRLKSLIKFLPYNRNDTILINSEEYIVENITKNKVVLRSKSGTKLIKDYSFFFNRNVNIKT